MKLDQLIEYNKRNNFLQKNHAKDKAGRVVTDLFLFLKKALYDIKVGGLELGFNIFLFLNLAYNKNKLHKTLGY